jgi:hypothetical protein
MNTLAEKYKIYKEDRRALFSLVFSFVLLIFSLFVNFYAGTYAAKEASNYVNDIILSNIRAFDIDGIFIYGPLVLWAFVAYLLLKDPHKIPFTLKSIALFVLIRSVFVTLTHIGPFPTGIALDSDIINKFTFGADLFFSAHTGLPFLMALVFWKDTYLRVIFTVAALFFGAVVLLAHLHYSIDVLSAFFITYSIYVIAERLFKKDKRLYDTTFLIDAT